MLSLQVQGGIMKAFVTALLLFSLISPPVLAGPAGGSVVEGEQVRYIGGSIAGVKENTIGRFDTSQSIALAFEFSEGNAEIPYKLIRAFQYEEKLARRLGVVATIAVALVKHRQRRHIIKISYFDREGIPQAAVFEVSKDKATAVVAVLEARAPKPCPYNDRNIKEGRTDEGEACRIPPNFAFSQTD
jgi:hypothetical protein